MSLIIKTGQYIKITVFVVTVKNMYGAPWRLLKFPVVASRQSKSLHKQK